MNRKTSLRLFALLILLALLTSSLPGLPRQVQPALAQREICEGEFLPVSLPLPELGSQAYTRMDGQATEFTGGLYPGGSNVRPPEHEAAGQALAAQIQPLAPDGSPDPVNGRIIVISIGMSNTGQEFGEFQKMARNNPLINSKVFLINGGVGGRTAEFWVDPNSDAWDELQRRLDHYEISAEMVQVAWIKLTLFQGGDFPAKAVELEEHLELIVKDLKRRFPNLNLAFLSSRTRSYTYWRGLSPEPVAFETGFSVKWLIERQIEGNPDLNYDPGRGEVKAPYLSWGPYLWVDGENERADGLVWTADDLYSDCTHPSEEGMRKVATLLTDFFMNDSLTASWFSAAGAAAATPAPWPTTALAAQASATLTQEPAPSATSSATAASATSTPAPTGLPLISITPTPAADQEAPPFNLFSPGMMLLVGLTLGLFIGLGRNLLRGRK